jgi:hypothetical protein
MHWCADVVGSCTMHAAQSRRWASLSWPHSRTLRRLQIQCAWCRHVDLRLLCSRLRNYSCKVASRTCCACIDDPVPELDLISAQLKHCGICGTSLLYAAWAGETCLQREAANANLSRVTSVHSRAQNSEYRFDNMSRTACLGRERNRNGVGTPARALDPRSPNANDAVKNALACIWL